MAGDERAKRKTGQRQFALRRTVCHHREQIIQLATAIVVRANTGAHTSKVEADGAPAALHKRARHGLHHLVIHGPAKQRVRVRNDRYATGNRARRQRGLIAHSLNLTGRAGDCEPLCVNIHGLTFCYYFNSYLCILDEG